ncbi:MAG: beta-ketoacyl-ACP synthase III [Rhodospirillales bacterium]|nr:beta-ketoacyl-ACP synthase III [Rhodospirillales bacterium]
MVDVAISGTGLMVPPHTVTNEELVEGFNAYVELFNSENAEAIAAGTVTAKEGSSAAFVEKASGIKSRYAMVKDGMLDPAHMRPRIPADSNGTPDKPSMMAEMAIEAAKQALEQAGREGKDIDLVICSASALQRPYPAIAIEVQKELGCGGFAFDMQVACSAATFALGSAADMIRGGTAKRALLVNPEITTAHLNLRDRDSHFIFGDVCTATVLEKVEDCDGDETYRILGQKFLTQFSDNIRTNFGFLTRMHEELIDDPQMWFVQHGRKVFKELLPLVCKHIEGHLADHQLGAEDLKRMWLHQANINMNLFATRKLLGREASNEEAPIILDEFANTASAGSIIAFHRHRDGIEKGDKGIICSFGAGYSVGSLLVQRI